ncbi:uncharacterized protein LOC135617574 isoform X5 [Musa acuminata AAA Group]|uniref:uncharacterized protein LOC108952340 isoform X5 n=1 Tax=Musa acuminata AAA Group TaxID=214697 RepID=UPI0031E0EB1C
MKRRSCRMVTVTVGMYEEAACPNICYLLLQEQSTHLPHVFLHQRHVTLFVGPDEHVAHARLLVDGAGGAQVASTVVHAVPRPNLGTRVKKSCALVVDEIDGKLALRSGSGSGVTLLACQLSLAQRAMFKEVGCIRRGWPAASSRGILVTTRTTTLRAIYHRSPPPSQL